VELFPEIPFADWKDTLATVHRFAQIVGKIRLAASPRRNHWWHVPFHVTGRGITTRPMTDGATIFTVDFDFLDHRIDITALTGDRHSFPLAGQSVASFSDHMRRGLSAVGVNVTIAHPRPFDLPDSGRPFAEDTEHDTYDPAAVNRYWRVLSQVNLLLETFAAGYSGKTSPVHHFWHTFDIAVTRFGDKHVEHSAATDPVTREAYSRDVISFGSGSATTPSPNQPSTPTPPRNPAACPTSRCNPRSPGGSSATAAISRCCATPMPDHCASRAPQCSTSTKAPTRPVPAAPGGTSPTGPAPAASPTPNSSGGYRRFHPPKCSWCRFSSANGVNVTTTGGSAL
jgi:hypothetical protein